MATSRPTSHTQTIDGAARFTLLRDHLAAAGLYGGSAPVFRLAPSPFRLTPEQRAFLDALGPAVLEFYTALNRLYLASHNGQQPTWVAAYLDQGKPESVIATNRMNRFKTQLPGVLRPDLILIEPDAGGHSGSSHPGLIATELDSVPGGIGLTGCLARGYTELGAAVIGGGDGMVTGFAAMIRSLAGAPAPQVAAVISDESRDYRPETQWLMQQLAASGVPAVALEPKQAHFTDEALEADFPDGRARIDVLYRFFELFDLPNIPKSELLLYAAKKGMVRMTPPPKAQLEEKLAFALFWHPVLRPYWDSALSPGARATLAVVLPKTWIVDPRPLPPHAVIPGIEAGGAPLTDWRRLAGATQKERRLVLKPSGFSELAWGARGVVVGHDVAAEAWAEAIETALAAFPTRPYVLQPFHKGASVEVAYFDAGGATVPMQGRVRLSPYYFVADGGTRLGGVLATIVPVEKKLIHGMTDAVMVPCGA